MRKGVQSDDIKTQGAFIFHFYRLRHQMIIKMTSAKNVTSPRNLEQKFPLYYEIEKRRTNACLCGEGKWEKRSGKVGGERVQSESHITSQ